MVDERLILVTSAAGKTGLAVIRVLVTRGARVRALVHHAEQTEIVKVAGAANVVIGELADQSLLTKALDQVSAVYLVCPNMHPHETELGLSVIAAAKKSGVQQIVYHSVLFPQIEAMPHHWQKLRVEEALIQSSLAFTILQPASYMQNIVPYWETVKRAGEYRVPYSIDAEFSPIDLSDVAEAACKCLLESGHAGAIYQLAGPQRLTSIQIAAAMGKALGREVHAIPQPLDEWTKSAKAAGQSQYTIDTLGKMFSYYNKNGLAASSMTTEIVLSRPAKTFSQYVETLT